MALGLRACVVRIAAIMFSFSERLSQVYFDDVEPVELGTKGTLWTWTIQGFPPKAPPI